MAAASARNLHEAQLACTMHAEENHYCEDSLQEPRERRLPRRWPEIDRVPVQLNQSLEDVLRGFVL